MSKRDWLARLIKTRSRDCLAWPGSPYTWFQQPPGKKYEKRKNTGVFKKFENGNRWALSCSTKAAILMKSLLNLGTKYTSATHAKITATKLSIQMSCMKPVLLLHSNKWAKSSQWSYQQMDKLSTETLSRSSYEVHHLRTKHFPKTSNGPSFQTCSWSNGNLFVCPLADEFQLLPR